MQTALLLIALGFGFKIFAEASTNAKKSVKQLGRLVGAFIMLVSFLGTICMVACAIQYGKMYPMGRGWMGGGKMCPITGMSSNPSASDQTKK